MIDLVYFHETMRGISQTFKRRGENDKSQLVVKLRWERAYLLGFT